MSGTRQTKVRQSLSKHSKEELLRIREDLERMEMEGRGREHRDSERIAYHEDYILLRVLGLPKGADDTFLVVPRDISESGMSFLHGSFLYPGSECRFTLRTNGGEVVTVSAEIKRCRLVEQNVHEIGARFEESIRVSDFVFAAKRAA